MPLEKQHAFWHFARRTGQDAVTELVSPMRFTSGKKSICRGLWILASTGHSMGHEICWRDGEELCLSSLIEDFKWADQLWLYAMTPTITKCLTLAKKAKQINPHIKILLGGVHVSIKYHETFKLCPDIDVICKNKQPAHNLMKFVEDITLMPGCLVKIKDKIRLNKSIKYNEYNETVDPNILESSLQDYYINVSASTGCPFSCNFCMDGSEEFRKRNFDNLCNELLLYNSKLPQKTPIYFFDTIFTYPKDRCIKICKFISKNSTSNYFCCDIKTGTIDREVLTALYHARIRFISIGFETSIDKILQKANKKQSFKHSIDTANLIRKYMPYTAIKAYWLLGLPGTTTDTLRQDIESIKYLLEENIVDIVSPKLFVPYPGTNYYNEPDKHGLVFRTRNYAEYDRFRLPPVCYPKSVGKQKLSEALIIIEKTVAELYSRRLSISIKELVSSTNVPKRYNGPLYAKKPF